MELTVKKLGQIAGISTRTLRYYDEIGILTPARINSSGYRIYTDHEINQLQQILFYKALGVALEDIKEIVSSVDFDPVTALKEHHKNLLIKRKQLDRLIRNVEDSIAESEGSKSMTVEEKFEGFKQSLIEENEAKYGNEIRHKYGDAVVDEANKKMLNMTKENYDYFKALEKEILATLVQAVLSNDPTSELAVKTAKLHQEWLSYTWSHYTKEAHMNLAEMYVADERFSKYYNDAVAGGAVFLRDAIAHYLQ